MAQLTLEDSGTLWYEDTGEGPVLVSVHGWAMHGGLFAPQVELAGRFRLITPDLRGQGRSSPLGPDHDLATLAADLGVLLERLSLERVLLHGWSMGALVVWELMAGPAAARVAGLIVEDMSPRILNDRSWQLGLLGGHDRATTERLILQMSSDWPAYIELFVPRIFAARRAARDARLLQVARAAALQADPASMARLWASMAGADFRAIVPRISVPTWIVHGGASQLYPTAVSQWLVSQMPNARRVCFETCGHAPHLEDPAHFNRVITDCADALGLLRAEHASGPAPAEVELETPVTGDRS